MIKKTWLDSTVSLYTSHFDNFGRPATLREILLSTFDRDLPHIIKLRKLDRSDKDYWESKKSIKAILQCYTPAALLERKDSEKVKEINRTGIVQLDFDYEDIKDYDIEELKRAVFALPFIGFCGLSCSGDGFYALALIAEPERLEEYAEHLFTFLIEEGIKPDTSKGKKAENLRYLSYDANMLLREDPIFLQLTSFKKRSPAVIHSRQSRTSFKLLDGNGYLQKALSNIQNAMPGNRTIIVQKEAYTLGGYGQPDYLETVLQAINVTPAFAGEQNEFIQCAKDCFSAGMANPFKK